MSSLSLQFTIGKTKPIPLLISHELRNYTNLIWALVKNKKIEAIPDTKGTCPLCEGRVFSKCGEVNDWHWAHFEAENCDSWYEPESYWHHHWKMTFGKDNSEIGIKKNGKWHKADILTNKNVVIELQNSPIQKPVIREREEFYGERMMWLINGNKFKQNFSIKDRDNFSTWWGHTHDSTSGKKGEKVFQWDYARRSWEDVQRPVFIDFGEEKLFWVKEGMGARKGNGIFVSKEKFIKKYGGNYEYYYERKR